MNGIPLLSRVAKHQIRHLTPIWSGQPAWCCTWPLKSSSEATVTMYESTHTLYHPRELQDPTTQRTHNEQHASYCDGGLFLYLGELYLNGCAMG